MNGNRGAIQELFSPFSPMYEGFDSGTTPVKISSRPDYYYTYNAELKYDRDTIVLDENNEYYISISDDNDASLNNNTNWTKIPQMSDRNNCNSVKFDTNELLVDNNNNLLYVDSPGIRKCGFYASSIGSGSHIHDVDKSRLVNINSRYLDISGNIKTYGTIYADISNNYDYGKPDEFPEFAEITRDDVLNQDLQFLMAQQKNTHMIGMIAIATLAVGIFYIARNFRTDTE